MSDSYQAIFDAVRSRIGGGGNISDAVREVAREAFDISYLREEASQALQILAYEWNRPSILLRPTLHQDGNAWLAIYGDLPSGVVGTGGTPAEAMAAFDKAYTTAAQVVNS